MSDDENSIEIQGKKTSSQSIYEDVFFSNYIAWIIEEIWENFKLSLLSGTN